MVFTLQDRVPIQYITHTAHWRDLVLAVGPGVLVPRPETELIIDFVADVLDAHPDLRQCPWADLGTGCGALAIGLAKLLCRVSLIQSHRCVVCRPWIGSSSVSL